VARSPDDRVWVERLTRETQWRRVDRSFSRPRKWAPPWTQEGFGA